MPGGFAHITAVGIARRQLKQIDAFTLKDRRDLAAFRPFFEIGAVGPDYPYLGFQAPWADNMHYSSTGDVIRSGVRRLRSMPVGPERNQCLAWLLGYAAHVAADLTIHPTVGLLVGPYEENPTDHRICEMHQDAFIWSRNGLGEIGVADYVRQMIEQCSTPDGDLEPALVSFWTSILHDAYVNDCAHDAPRINAWNHGFKTIVDAVDDVGAFFPFSRHMLAAHGLAYPSPEDVDRKYIDDLQTPEGRMGYDAIFDRAVESIVRVWASIGAALNAQAPDAVEQALMTIPDANLDTGQRFADSTQVFWSVA